MENQKINQKTLRAKIYEFIKTKGFVMDDKSKEEFKALITEYKDYFLNIQKEQQPPLPPVQPNSAPKYKEQWHTYSPTE